MNAHRPSQSIWGRNRRRYHKFPKPVYRSEKLQRKWSLPVLHPLPKDKNLRLSASAQTSAQTPVICTEAMSGSLSENKA